MGGKHRVTRSIGITAAIVAVCGVAVLLGYAMGNYAITAITAMRHRPPTAAPPAPVGEPAAPSPESSAEKAPPAPAASPDQPAAGPSAPASPLYRVQLGPFATRQEAVATAGRLLADGYPTYVTAERPHRVQVGAFSRREAAARLVSELKARNYANVRLVEP